MRRARRLEHHRRSIERGRRAQRVAFTFREYIETGHLNEAWGYYGSGRVRFGAIDVGFKTTPILLSPAFGGMIAENARLTFGALGLASDERFTLLECGGGDGTLARDILGHARARAAASPGGEWERLYRQLDYVIVEGSPRLAERQRAAVADHPGKLRVVVGNARDLGELLPAGALVGMAVSNELLDDLGVHKVRFARAPAATTTALCIPRVAARPLAPLVGQPRLAALRVASDAITSALDLPPPPRGALYLAKADYVAARDRLAPTEEEHFLRGLSFHEIQVPARAVDGLAEHLGAWRAYYAALLAATPAPAITLYVNTDAVRYVAGLARAFRRGRFLTVDYGDRLIDAVRARGLHRRLLLYGPGAKSIMQDCAYWGTEPDPYVAHGKLNVTFTQDFDLVRIAGERAGLRTLRVGGEDLLRDGVVDDVELDRLAEALLDRLARAPEPRLPPPPPGADRRAAVAHARGQILDALARSAGTFSALVQQKGLD